MNKFVTENLLLLEFLVDDIYFNDATKKKMKCIQGETNVMFQFLDNRPIIISAQELQANCPGNATRTGKSCLFSMSTDQGIEALGNFLISLKVFQKFPPGVLPNTIDVGWGEICISELFQDLMESAMGSSEKAWVKCLKETAKMFMCGEWVGTVSCFIRMSCYGKYIVTQCEMNVGDFKQNRSPDDITQKSKCLPVPEDVIVGFAHTTHNQTPPLTPRGQGEGGQISPDDPCCKITRWDPKTPPATQSPRLTGMQGDFVSSMSPRDMAFDMLQVPSTPSSPRPSTGPHYPRTSFNTTCTNESDRPISNFSQLPYQSPLQLPMSPMAPPNTPMVTPCAPCPATVPKPPVPEFPKELVARAPELLIKKRVPLIKPSKDKLILRLAMPNYGPKCDPPKPYEFEFVTPAGWPRESLGKQCRDAQCDCKDFPKGYLLGYYGEEKLCRTLYKQMNEEARREKVYGICPVGEFAKTPRSKKMGISDLYYKCLGVTDMMKKYAKFIARYGANATYDDIGRSGGKGGKGGGENDEDGKNKNKRRKLNPSAGIIPPDKCKPYASDSTCGVCNPCNPCRPCNSCAPCLPCLPCNPCVSFMGEQACVPCKTGSSKLCSRCP